jgi:hypothetical protein
MCMNVYHGPPNILVSYPALVLTDYQLKI